MFTPINTSMNRSEEKGSESLLETAASTGCNDVSSFSSGAIAGPENTLSRPLGVPVGKANIVASQQVQNMTTAAKARIPGVCDDPTLFAPPLSALTTTADNPPIPAPAHVYTDHRRTVTLADPLTSALSTLEAAPVVQHAGSPFPTTAPTSDPASVHASSPVSTPQHPAMQAFLTTLAAAKPVGPQPAAIPSALLPASSVTSPSQPTASHANMPPHARAHAHSQAQTQIAKQAQVHVRSPAGYGQASGRGSTPAAAPLVPAHVLLGCRDYAEALSVVRGAHAHAQAPSRTPQRSPAWSPAGPPRTGAQAAREQRQSFGTTASGKKERKSGKSSPHNNSQSGAMRSPASPLFPPRDVAHKGGAATVSTVAPPPHALVSSTATHASAHASAPAFTPASATPATATLTAAATHTPPATLQTATSASTAAATAAAMDTATGTGASLPATGVGTPAHTPLSWSAFFASPLSGLGSRAPLEGGRAGSDGRPDNCHVIAQGGGAVSSGGLVNPPGPVSNIAQPPNSGSDGIGIAELGSGTPQASAHAHARLESESAVDVNPGRATTAVAGPAIAAGPAAGLEAAMPTGVGGSFVPPIAANTTDQHAAHAMQALPAEQTMSLPHTHPPASAPAPLPQMPIAAYTHTAGGVPSTSAVTSTLGRNGPAHTGAQAHAYVPGPPGHAHAHQQQPWPGQTPVQWQPQQQSLPGVGTQQQHLPGMSVQPQALPHAQPQAQWMSSSQTHSLSSAVSLPGQPLTGSPWMPPPYQAHHVLPSQTHLMHAQQGQAYTQAATLHGQHPYPPAYAYHTHAHTQPTHVQVGTLVSPALAPALPAMPAKKKRERTKKAGASVSAAGGEEKDNSVKKRRRSNATAATAVTLSTGAGSIVAQSSGDMHASMHAHVPPQASTYTVLPALPASTHAAHAPHCLQGLPGLQGSSTQPLPATHTMQATNFAQAMHASWAQATTTQSQSLPIALSREQGTHMQVPLAVPASLAATRTAAHGQRASGVAASVDVSTGAGTGVDRGMSDEAEEKETQEVWMPVPVSTDETDREKRSKEEAEGAGAQARGGPRGAYGRGAEGGGRDVGAKTEGEADEHVYKKSAVQSDDDERGDEPEEEAGSADARSGRSGGDSGEDEEDQRGKVEGGRGADDSQDTLGTGRRRRVRRASAVDYDEIGRYVAGSDALNGAAEGRRGRGRGRGRGGRGGAAERGERSEAGGEGDGAGAGAGVGEGPTAGKTGERSQRKRGKAAAAVAAQPTLLAGPGDGTGTLLFGAAGAASEGAQGQQPAPAGRRRRGAGAAAGGSGGRRKKGAAAAAGEGTDGPMGAGGIMVPMGSMSNAHARVQMGAGADAALGMGAGRGGVPGVPGHMRAASLAAMGLESDAGVGVGLSAGDGRMGVGSGGAQVLVQAAGLGSVAARIQALAKPLSTTLRLSSALRTMRMLRGLRVHKLPTREDYLRLQMQRQTQVQGEEQERRPVARQVACDGRGSGSSRVGNNSANVCGVGNAQGLHGDARHAEATEPGMWGGDSRVHARQVCGADTSGECGVDSCTRTASRSVHAGASEGSRSGTTKDIGGGGSGVCRDAAMPCSVQPTLNARQLARAHTLLADTRASMTVIPARPLSLATAGPPRGTSTGTGTGTGTSCLDGYNGRGGQGDNSQSAHGDGSDGSGLGGTAQGSISDGCARGLQRDPVGGSIGASGVLGVGEVSAAPTSLTGTPMRPSSPTPPIFPFASVFPLELPTHTHTRSIQPNAQPNANTQTQPHANAVLHNSPLATAAFAAASTSAAATSSATCSPQLAARPTSLSAVSLTFAHSPFAASANRRADDQRSSRPGSVSLGSRPVSLSLPMRTAFLTAPATAPVTASMPMAARTLTAINTGFARSPALQSTYALTLARDGTNSSTVLRPVSMALGGPTSTPLLPLALPPTRLTPTTTSTLPATLSTYTPAPVAAHTSNTLSVLPREGTLPPPAPVPFLSLGGLYTQTQSQMQAQTYTHAPMSAHLQPHTQTRAQTQVLPPLRLLPTEAMTTQPTEAWTAPHTCTVTQEVPAVSPVGAAAQSALVKTQVQLMPGEETGSAAGGVSAAGSIQHAEVEEKEVQESASKGKDEDRWVQRAASAAETTGAAAALGMSVHGAAVTAPDSHVRCDSSTTPGGGGGDGNCDGACEGATGHTPGSRHMARGPHSHHDTDHNGHLGKPAYAYAAVPATMMTSASVSARSSLPAPILTSGSVLSSVQQQGRPSQSPRAPPPLEDVSCDGHAAPSTAHAVSQGTHTGTGAARADTLAPPPAAPLKPLPTAVETADGVSKTSAASPARGNVSTAPVVCAPRRPPRQPSVFLFDVHSRSARAQARTHTPAQSRVPLVPQPAHKDAQTQPHMDTRAVAPVQSMQARIYPPLPADNNTRLPAHCPSGLLLAGTRSGLSALAVHTRPVSMGTHVNAQHVGQASQASPSRVSEGQLGPTAVTLQQLLRPATHIQPLLCAQPSLAHPLPRVSALTQTTSSLQGQRAHAQHSTALARNGAVLGTLSTLLHPHPHAHALPLSLAPRPPSSLHLAYATLHTHSHQPPTQPPSPTSPFSSDSSPASPLTTTHQPAHQATRPRTRRRARMVLTNSRKKKDATAARIRQFRARMRASQQSPLSRARARKEDGSARDGV